MLYLSARGRRKKDRVRVKVKVRKGYRVQETYAIKRKYPTRQRMCSDNAKGRSTGMVWGEVTGSDLFCRLERGRWLIPRFIMIHSSSYSSETLSHVCMCGCRSGNGPVPMENQ